MRYLIIPFIICLFAGCATVQTVTFQDKERTYNVDFYSAWNKSIEMLTHENFPLKTLDKNNGLIHTDYIPGTYLFHKARYSLSLFISVIDANKVKITITPHYEVYMPSPPLSSSPGEWVTGNDRDKALVDKYFVSLDKVIYK